MRFVLSLAILIQVIFVGVCFGASIGIPDGVYRGLGPTDESAVGLGEIEMTVKGDIANVRWATGHEIVKDTFDLALLRAPKEEDVHASELNGKNVSTNENTTIHFFESSDGMRLIYLPNEGKAPSLVIYTGGMGDLLAPLMLWSPTQVAAGWFKAALKEMEREAKSGDIKYARSNRIVPRLAFNGTPSPKTCIQILRNAIGLIK